MCAFAINLTDVFMSFCSIQQSSVVIVNTKGINWIGANNSNKLQQCMKKVVKYNDAFRSQVKHFKLQFSFAMVNIEGVHCHIAIIIRHFTSSEKFDNVEYKSYFQFLQQCKLKLSFAIVPTENVHNDRVNKTIIYVKIPFLYQE